MVDTVRHIIISVVGVFFALALLSEGIQAFDNTCAKYHSFLGLKCD